MEIRLITQDFSCVQYSSTVKMVEMYRKHSPGVFGLTSDIHGQMTNEKQTSFLFQMVIRNGHPRPRKWD